MQLKLIISWFVCVKIVNPTIGDNGTRALRQLQAEDDEERFQADLFAFQAPFGNEQHLLHDETAEQRYVSLLISFCILFLLFCHFILHSRIINSDSKYSLLSLICFLPQFLSSCISW